jgi:hypothetical protein
MTDPAFLKAALNMLGFSFEERGNTIMLNSITIGYDHPKFVREDVNSPYVLNYSHYNDEVFRISTKNNALQKTIESMRIKSAEDFQKRIVGAYNLSRQMQAAIQAGFTVSSTTINEQETVVRLTRSAGGF